MGLGTGHVGLSADGNELTFQHLRLEPDYRKNLTFADFKGGHMVYNEPWRSREMKHALDAWYQEALKAGK